MAQSTASDNSEAISQIRRMRLASFLEATTLTVLVFIAVPLKHIFGLPLATAIMGPIHGIAFVFYIWMLVQTVSGGGWPRAIIARMILFAFIPLAGFVNERLLWRQEQKLAADAA
ncbi:MAG: rane protein [Rhizobium sp.]|nr:rane protein [Rhizobium sp.]